MIRSGFRDGMALADLLTPITREEFVAQYWGVKPLTVIRSTTGYYSRLLAKDGLNFALHAASQSPGALEILSEDATPKRCRSYLEAVRAFQDGNSLRIDGIQRFSKPIRDLCCSLEQTISSCVNVNMYLTPGAGKKALNRHYDTHDVFVLQIMGNKQWRLYDSPFPAPLEHLPRLRNESVGAMTKFRLSMDMSERDKVSLTKEFLLQAGDCLYLPRGFWHEAESLPGEVSCHLTVGIQPTTYLDLLSAALSEAAIADRRFREPLPLGFAADPSHKETVARGVSEIVASLPQKLNVEDALGKLAGHFSRLAQPDLSSSILDEFIQAEKFSGIEEETLLRVRDGIASRVDTSVVPARMYVGRSVFEIAPAYEAACRFILTTESFKVADLPGALRPAEKIVLAKQLVSEGLLIGEDCNEAGLLPVRVDIENSRVTWMDFEKEPLTEPFFHQSLQRLRQRRPGAKENVTSLAELEQMQEEIAPSGFIFHISRCGSTLLSNALRCAPGAIVVSEPPATSDALSSLLRREDANAELESKVMRAVAALVRAYGLKRADDEKGLVIKFTSWNILFVEQIRKLWPNVPCLFVIRDPVEVAVSCLEQPPAWMGPRFRQEMAAKALQMASGEVASLSDEEFCARMVGMFLDRAAAHIGAQCTAVDYTDLNEALIGQAVERFGLSLTADSRQSIQQTLAAYSKDPTGKRHFITDIAAKKAKATSELRRYIDRWAAAPYQLLRDSASMASKGAIEESAQSPVLLQF